MSDLPVLNAYGLAPNMSKEEIYKLPLKNFTGKILLVDTLEAFNEVYNYIHNLSILGFDTETKPSFKKGNRNQVSLVQLANDDLAVLIRIKKFGILANGLREMTAILLGFRISKSQQVTNWDAAELTESQLIYAATDAWVGYQIFAKLNSLKSI